MEQPTNQQPQRTIIPGVTRQWLGTSWHYHCRGKWLGYYDPRGNLYLHGPFSYRTWYFSWARWTRTTRLIIVRRMGRDLIRFKMSTE